MFLMLLLNMTFNFQSVTADSGQFKVLKAQDEYFLVTMNQMDDSIELRITNLKSDTLRYYLGFMGYDSSGRSNRYDYNVFMHKRPLGGKFATPTISIAPGETQIKKHRIAPLLYRYIVGQWRYDWFIGYYLRAEKQYEFLVLKA